MDLEVCPLFDCRTNRKGLEHCGHCDELPCRVFTDFHDPALTPEQAAESVNARLAALERRKDVGTEKWLEETTQSRSDPERLTCGSPVVPGAVPKNRGAALTVAVPAGLIERRGTDPGDKRRHGGSEWRITTGTEA